MAKANFDKTKPLTARPLSPAVHRGVVNPPTPGQANNPTDVKRVAATGGKKGK